MTGGTWEIINGRYRYRYGYQNVTGFQEIDGQWYYFYPNGDMAEDWVQVENKWYYAIPGNGSLILDKRIKIDNKNYYFNANGEWVNKKPKFALYETSKYGRGPCNGVNNGLGPAIYVNQASFWFNEQTQQDEFWAPCWVGMEQKKYGFSSEGACHEGPFYCKSTQNFCSINKSQTVKDILPQTDWDLTYGYDSTKEEGKKWGYYFPYDQGSIIYAQLWQRIYQIFLNIYYYPYPDGDDDIERRGRRNPEIWSLISPLQVAKTRPNENYIDTDDDPNNIWDADESAVHWRSIMFPVVPRLDKVKQGYKVIDDFYSIYKTRFDGKKVIDVTSKLFTYDFYINNFEKLQIRETYSKWSDKDAQYHYYDIYPYIQQRSYAPRKDDEGTVIFGYDTLKRKLNDNYHQNRCYYNYASSYHNYEETNYGHWKVDGSADANGYCYLYDDTLYEPLADDEIYVKFVNPNTAELPKYKPYDFNAVNWEQWFNDVCNGLVYIQHNNFLNFISKGFGKDTSFILFDLYKEVLDKLETEVPDGQAPQKTYITKEIIDNIQTLIKEYKINGDRCRACNSHCNDGVCEAGYQDCFTEASPCLFEKQYGSGGGGQVDTSVTNTDLVWCHSPDGSWTCVNRNT